MDHGHELTEELLKGLEQRIADEYAVAVRDMEEKVSDYFSRFAADDERWKAAVEAGERTAAEYQDWRFRQTMMGQHWTAMRDSLAQDLSHARDKALELSGKAMPDVFALNGNWATYQIEHDAQIDTGFTLYNHDTAAYLLTDTRQLMPPPSEKKAAQIAADPSMQWEQQKIQSAVLQGVLQGEGPEKIAQRLMGVGQMSYNASVRYARTMTTSAQNAGRYEAFHRAQGLGIDLVIEWQAVLDHRTRDAHRQMHGQRRDLDEPFETPDGYSIMYPADCSGSSDAPQKEIWNCRCTLLGWVRGFEGETVKESPGMGDLTFEEWQGYKNMSTQPSSDGETEPGQQITPQELSRFAAEVEARGYRFAPSVTGLSSPQYGGFELYCGDVSELYGILDELDESRKIWPERLQRKGLLIGYEPFGTISDFARSAGRTIFFNKKVYDDSAFLRRSYAEAVAEGIFVKGTTQRAVAWHELGHVLQKLDPHLYRRLMTRIAEDGNTDGIALKLTSGYGITETDDGRLNELFCELLSATRSSDEEKRNNALSVVKDVL